MKKGSNTLDKLKFSGSENRFSNKPPVAMAILMSRRQKWKKGSNTLDKLKFLGSENRRWEQSIAEFRDMGMKHQINKLI